MRRGEARGRAGGGDERQQEENGVKGMREGRTTGEGGEEIREKLSLRSVKGQQPTL